MKNVLCTLCLVTTVMFAASASVDTFAQGKKTAAKAGTIELIQSKDGKIRFSVRDAEGKYLGGSTVGHATEKEARAAVEELKKVLATATYVRKKSDDSKSDKGE